MTNIKNVENNKKKLYIFIPLGIPGMGKSTFVQIIQPILEMNKFEFNVVSSDELRDQVIQNYISKNNGYPTRDEAFEKTQKNFSKIWNEEVITVIKSFKSHNNALFLDKNHPHNAINSTMVNINQNIRSD